MKMILVATLALIPALSHADFRPGRVRPNAYAVMEIRQATGVFAGAKEVLLTEFTQDDKGVVSYELEVDGKPMNFQVNKYKRTDCGNVAKAEFAPVGHSSLNADMQLTDMSNALCEIYVNRNWEVQIEAKDSVKKEESSLRIEGNPEFLLQTLAR